MNGSSNVLELEFQNDSLAETPKPIFPPPPQAPSTRRRDWEERLHSLQAELEALDEAVFDDELPGGSTRSPLRTRREAILTRVADLKWLISGSGD